MTPANKFPIFYNDSSVTMTTSRCSHVNGNLMLKDRPLFLEISLPDVRYAGHGDNATNRTTSGRDESLVKVEILVQSVILSLAVAGNSCVLTALARRGKAGSRMHLFIFHLSIADLLVAVFNILPQLIWDITGSFYGGDGLCRYIKFMQIFVMYLSTYMLVMTAIDRYRAVCHPFSAFNSSSKMTIYAMIWAAYIISGILSLPQPIIFKFQEPEIGSGVLDCWVNFDPPWTLNLYVISFTMAIYIVPLIILIFAYISICRTIWKKHRTAKIERLNISNPVTGMDVSLTCRNVYSSYMVNKVVYRTSGVLERRPNIIRRNRLPPSTTPRAHSLRGFSRAKIKTVKLTFVVILAYLICWSPFFVSQIWWLHDAGQESNEAVVVMILLGSLNSCCNPWIYLAFSGNLIRHVCPVGYCTDQKRCDQQLCHLLRRHRYRRRRNSSINNNHDDHSQRSPSYDHVVNSRGVEFQDVELRELILNGASKKWQACKRPGPDTAGITTSSKTVVTKTGSPKVSQHSLKKDCLYKMVLQNGRLARDVDWACPLENNGPDREV